MSKNSLINAVKQQQQYRSNINADDWNETKKQQTKSINSDVFNDVPQTLNGVVYLLLTNSLTITEHASLSQKQGYSYVRRLYDNLF